MAKDITFYEHYASFYKNTLKEKTHNIMEEQNVTITVLSSIYLETPISLKETTIVNHALDFFEHE